MLGIIAEIPAFAGRDSGKMMTGSTSKIIARFPLHNNLFFGQLLNKAAEHPVVRQRGWSQQQLQGLARSAVTIARNFANLTNGVMLDVALTSEVSAKNEPVVAVAAGQNAVELSLAGEPAKITAISPLVLSQLLVDVIVRPRPLFPGISVLMPGIFPPISQGSHQVNAFLRDIRRLVVDEEALANIFATYAMVFGAQVAKQRLSFDLLDSLEFPRRLVGDKWQQTLAATRQKIEQSDQPAQDLSVWETMANLASIDVIAQQRGFDEIAAQCREFLHGQPARELAYLDFLQLTGSETDHYAHLPYETTRQIELSAAGLSITYEAFRTIFDHFYRSVRVANDN